MLPVVIIATSVMLLGVATVAEHQAREMPPDMVRAKANADLLRSFDWLVTSYMASHPAHNGALTWATIAASTSTPPGMANSPKYANFSAIGTATNYRICTSFGAAELQYVRSMLPLRKVPTASGEEVCAAP